MKNNTHSNCRQISVSLLPGTAEWLKKQKDPSGVVQAALIEYRKKKEKQDNI